jgi:hypothetical protein
MLPLVGRPARLVGMARVRPGPKGNITTPGAQERLGSMST